MNGGIGLTTFLFTPGSFKSTNQRFMVIRYTVAEGAKGHQPHVSPRNSKSVFAMDYMSIDTRSMWELMKYLGVNKLLNSNKTWMSFVTVKLI